MTVAPEDLISPEYRREQELLHAAPRGYGAKGDRWAGAVYELAQRHACSTVLDYGAGQQSLARALNSHPDLAVRSYDPAIPSIAALPLPADLVVCTDVLEHCEPDRIGAVLAHLYALTGKVLFVVIGLQPTDKTLSDGRQAHILLEEPKWWKRYLKASGFVIQWQEHLSGGKAWSAAFIPVPKD